MLSAVNTAIICLIPKVKDPSVVSDYRPISCCTTIYKCISKLLASKLKAVLPSLISMSQSAYVEGRSIVDNIHLSHELIIGYNRKNISQRCCIKYDVRKAFDTTRWYLISMNQSAYVEGCSIVDNIHLSHKLILGYNRKNISQRCCIKYDVRKAFDTTRWEAIICILRLMNFPEKFIQYIYTCISTTSFSVNVNGQDTGFFGGKQRLW